MRARHGLVVWAISAAGCREQNPYFVEPPLATSSGATSGSESGATTDEVTAAPTSGSTTNIVGDTEGMSATDSDGGTTEITATTNGLCIAGTVVCEGATKQVCDGMGGYASEEACPVMCSPGLGCTVCAPQTSQCDGAVVQVCADDGSAWVDGETCDALQGLACEGGACAGDCTDAKLGLRQLGCDFYGSSLASRHFDGWSAPFGLMAVNTGFADATVTVTRGDMMVTQVMVPAFGGQTIELGYIDEVSQSGLDDGYASVLVSDGAYRLRSTQPLAVYQYEPLEPASSGDASLLLPVHTWGSEYMIASRQHEVGGEQEPMSGFYAVVASEDGTQVTVTPSPTGGAAAPGGGIDAQGAGVVMLDAGDVLEVLSASGGDPSGARVVADRPVAVFGGHRCANVPQQISACDHLEESMPPISALSRDYFVTPPHGPTTDDLDQVVRIIATEANTTLTFTPGQDAATQLPQAGTWTEFIPTTPSFRVEADKKVVVAQYMSASDDLAGPSLAIAVPTEQYRNVYLVTASTLYGSRWVSFVAPSDAAVSIDGASIGALTPIGATGYSTTSVALPATASGANLLSSDKPFGAMVYGYYYATSYWYPAGLELQALP